MEFSMFFDSASETVCALVLELREFLEPEINTLYLNSGEFSLGIVVRCLPESYKKKSFIRYTKAKKDLTIDICIVLEEFTKLYKIEQRYELGNILLEYLQKAFKKHQFDDFDCKKFIKDIIKSGQPRGWFLDEVDWSKDFDS